MTTNHVASTRQQQRLPHEMVILLIGAVLQGMLHPPRTEAQEVSTRDKCVISNLLQPKRNEDA